MCYQHTYIFTSCLCVNVTASKCRYWRDLESSTGTASYEIETCKYFQCEEDVLKGSCEQVRRYPAKREMVWCPGVCAQGAVVGEKSEGGEKVEKGGKIEKEGK